MGSKRIGRSRDGRPIILDAKDKALRSWQGQLRSAMLRSAPDELLLGPVSVELTVFQLRPRSHYGTGKNVHVLKHSAPERPAGGRDLDKVARAAFDVGTGIWWRDDRQLCEVRLRRFYCEERPRLILIAWTL